MRISWGGIALISTHLNSRFVNIGSMFVTHLRMYNVVEYFARKLLNRQIKENLFFSNQINII